MSADAHAADTPEPIPQLDLAAQYAAIGGEIREAVERVLTSQQFILGREGAALEAEIAHLCGVAHGIGVGSGNDALVLSLRAVPVFTDIHPNTYNINPAELERRVTPRTSAIVVVHLYGLAADMDPIMAFARSKKLPVIEDAAQAISAAYKGRRTGALGDIACFSFYPTKNLGACGDAGMVVTNSQELADNVRTLRNHGQKEKYVSSEAGWNNRRNELQAAILRVKLRYLPKWQRARQTHAADYTSYFSQLPGIMPPLAPEGYEHVYHQYTIRVEDRDALQRLLTQQKIGSAVYYPVPLHLQPLYASLGYKRGDLPHAEHASHEVLSLPMYPELRAEQVKRVAETVVEFVKSEGHRPK